MSALTPQLRELLDSEIVGVVATVAENDRPRQSPTYTARDGDRLLISTEGGAMEGTGRETIRVGLDMRARLPSGAGLAS